MSIEVEGVANGERNDHTKLSKVSLFLVCVCVCVCTYVRVRAYVVYSTLLGSYPSPFKNPLWWT